MNALTLVAMLTASAIFGGVVVLVIALHICAKAIDDFFRTWR